MSLTRPTYDRLFFPQSDGSLMRSHVTLLPGLAAASSRPFLMGLWSACCPPQKQAAPARRPTPRLSPCHAGVLGCHRPLSRQCYHCSLVQTWAGAKFLSNLRAFAFFLWISVGAEEHLKHWPIVFKSVIDFAVMTSSTSP